MRITKESIDRTRLTDFAHQYHSQLVLDSCGGHIIPGPLGHLFNFGRGMFGILLEDLDSSVRTLLLTNKQRAIKAGFILHQEGDFEAVLLFDPGNHEQASLALELVGASIGDEIDIGSPSLEPDGRMLFTRA